MPKITVDGEIIEAKQGQMVLQACTDAGIDLPQYCYHPGLSIVASCRICLVEVEGIPKLVPSCQTPVRDGMTVHSKSPKAVANQKQVMEYLLVNHPLDCPVCDQAGECFLQDYSYQFGRSESRFEEDKAKKPKKDVGENIYLYSDRCIMCTRCVRFTREVSGTSELFVDGRGHREEIDIFPGRPCNNKLAGNVVDICPVGALLDKDFLFKQRVWLLKIAPSISPVDPGGVNIILDYNEGEDEVSKNPANGKQAFVIKAEKVPNAAGIRRVIEQLGGPSATWDEVAAAQKREVKKLKGGWVVGGYLSDWQPAKPVLPRGFKV